MVGFIKGRKGKSRLALLAGLLGIAALVGVWSVKDRPNPEVSPAAAFRVLVYPEKYTLAMSSTPGLRLQADCDVPVEKVRYAAEKGVMFTWDGRIGEISQGVSAIEAPYDLPAYWSPAEPRSDYSGDAGGDPIVINIALLDKNEEKIAEKQVNIVQEDSFFYSVKLSEDIIIGTKTASGTQLPKNLDQAGALAVKGQRTAYGLGETATEGHIILDSEEKDGKVKVYTIASYGAFAFENGIFTKVSGSGAIPTVMTFTKNEKGEYSLLDYQEPQDGALLVESTKKMFPQKLHSRVLSADKDYAVLVKQQETQAAEYLKSIGRTAPISAAYVEKKLAQINVAASNKLFAELTKHNPFLNACPYWLGTREKLENDVRYIYETTQSKTEDGYDLMIFQKKKEDGTVVEEAKYKIVGSEPRLID